MAFKLPRLQANMPIADAAGKALTAFSRLWDLFARLIEDNEAAQAEIIAQLQIVQQTQQGEIDRLNRVLAGTENFTGIQVGGQNVKPFLDKTDGDQITDTSGLADQLVSTAKVEDEAISDSVSALTLGTAILNTTTQVLLQSIAVSVTSGDRIEVTASASVFAQGAAGGTRGDFVNRPTMTVYRDTTFLGGTRPIAVHRDMQDYASAGISAIDFPPTGTVTYYFYSDLSSTTDIASLTAENRYLGAERFKR